MRDSKDVRQTEHPIDKLKLLQEFAMRDYKPNTANLIDPLLDIIDGLHNRISKLEEEKGLPNTKFNLFFCAKLKTSLVK